MLLCLYKGKKLEFLFKTITLKAFLIRLLALIFLPLFITSKLQAQTIPDCSTIVFTMAPVQSCCMSVTCSAYSEFGNYAWYVDGNPMAVGHASTLNYTFTSPGSHTITVTTLYSYFESDGTSYGWLWPKTAQCTKSASVNVYDLSFVGFSYSTVNGHDNSCTPSGDQQEVWFEAENIPAGSTLHWDFGNGDTKTTTSKCACGVYEPGKIYQVCLTVSGPCDFSPTQTCATHQICKQVCAGNCCGATTVISGGGNE
jgi:hypothetical protein